MDRVAQTTEVAMRCLRSELAAIRFLYEAVRVVSATLTVFSFSSLLVPIWSDVSFLWLGSSNAFWSWGRDFDLIVESGLSAS